MADAVAIIKKPSAEKRAKASKPARQEKASRSTGPSKRARSTKPGKPTKAPRAAQSIAARGVPSAGLVKRALALLEEVLPGEAKPVRLLAEPRRRNGLRGAFTETVQSVFAGVIDAREAYRLLREDLAPFVDGPALALALAAAGPSLDDLVDQFAIKALDDLARALLAIALDRPADVPATCAPFAGALGKHRDKVAALLG